MKQTAVEWLEMEFVKLESKYGILGEIYQLCEKAKEMEKQQIVEAVDYGKNHSYDYSEDNEVDYYSAEQYYNETFKSE